MSYLTAFWNSARWPDDEDYVSGEILGRLLGQGPRKAKMDLEQKTHSKSSKLLVKQRFGACKKVVQNTLQNLSFIDTVGALLAKRHSKV